MHIDRPVVLSIGGHDPCAGAGLFADIKTFEQHKVYGLAVCSAITLQTESHFISVKWEPLKDILSAVEKMLMHYEVRVVKIGIVENVAALSVIVSAINAINKDIRIIVDPVIMSSTGFKFWNADIDIDKLIDILSGVYLLTPNCEEAKLIFPSDNEKRSAQELSMFCNILLKGGHNLQEPGADYLFIKGDSQRIVSEPLTIHAKHGSGCVLSAAIASNLALGFDLISSCRLAKNYIERFLSGNKTLLGYHHV